MQDRIASEPDDAGNGNVGKNFNDGIVESVGKDRVLVGLHVAFVDVGKFAEGALFAIEQLQHHHSAYVFLKVSVDAGDGNADAAVGIANAVAKEFGGDGNERKHREGDQRQLPVHGEHDGNDSRQYEHILKNRDHARGEHFIQGVHVGSDACNEAPDGVLVIKSHVHAL